MDDRVKDIYRVVLSKSKGWRFYEKPKPVSEWRVPTIAERLLEAEARLERLNASSRKTLPQGYGLS